MSAGVGPASAIIRLKGIITRLGMMLLMKKLLKYIGMNPDRLRVEWVGASEGIRFADVMNDVSEKIKEMGPLGKSEGIDEKTLEVQI